MNEMEASNHRIQLEIRNFFNSFLFSIVWLQKTNFPTPHEVKGNRCRLFFALRPTTRLPFLIMLQ